MKRKLTPWYPTDIKPVRVGVYEFPGGFMRIWNGKNWMVPVGGSLGPLQEEAFECSIQEQKWRGLARKP